MSDRYKDDNKPIKRGTIKKVLREIEKAVPIGTEFIFVHDDRDGHTERCYLSHVDPKVGLRLTSLDKGGGDFTYCITVVNAPEDGAYTRQCSRILREILNSGMLGEVHWGPGLCRSTTCPF